MEKEALYALAKKEVDYDRQVAVFGQKAADNVLGFWILGFQHRETHTHDEVQKIKNILIDQVDGVSFMEQSQKDRFRDRMNDTGPDAEFMMGCSIKSVFDKAQNEIDMERTYRKRVEHDLLNRPEIKNFDNGYKLESLHQEQKWGDENHVPPHHYIMVLTHLLGKLTRAVWERDPDKFRHHLITMAAVCFNAHKKVEREETCINEWFYKK